MENNSKHPRAFGEDENGEMIHTNTPAAAWMVGVIVLLVLIIALF